MIAYYITSHGFGHAARACEVIRNLPPELPLTICSTVPEWFLRERLRQRDFTLRPRAFDCGALGPDSTRIDLELTLNTIEQLQRANAETLAEEVTWLRNSGARAVVSDVTPFALFAAAQAGVRSLLIANFTWSAIYQALGAALQGDEPTTHTLRQRMEAVIAVMSREYACGDLLLVPEMAIPMEACHTRRDVPIIAPHGTNRRMELCQALGLDPARRVVLVYLGRDGMDGMRWDMLKADGNQYIALAAPAASAGIFHPIPEGLLQPGDRPASVDAVVAKTGYGICSECIAAGTPLLYPPRSQFAEFGAVHTLMQSWGGGLCLDDERFKAGAWHAPIEHLLSRRGKLATLPTNGGPVCAAAICEGL